MPEFPIFDLQAYEAKTLEDQRLAAIDIDRICRTSGFLAIRDHGIDAAIIDNMWTAVTDFFAAPRDYKQSASAPVPGYPYGYLGPGTEALAKSQNVETPPDLKESFNGGPVSAPLGLSDGTALEFCYAPTIWPEDSEQFQLAWQTYYRSMETLAARIMRVFAKALDLEANFFDDYIDQPISALRALNYPEQVAPPLKNQLRAGAHTDYGSLTILLPEAGTEGLQIEAPSGGWMDVPPIPDAFVINIGDLMARWTNDRWKSTLHRVVNPTENGRTKARKSLAFFHQPNWFAEIECLETCISPTNVKKYEPVLSGPYLMSKFQSTVT